MLDLFFYPELVLSRFLKLNNNINSLLENAYNLLRDAKFDDVEKILKKILELDDNHADALYLMGMLKLKTGNLDVALTFLNRAVSANPEKANYHNDIALVYQQAGMLENSLKFFNKAIKLEPENHLFHFNIGNLYLNTGNQKKAVESYRKAIAIHQDFADAYNNLGQALHQLQDVDSAEFAYREAIRLNNTIASAYNNLGTLLQDKGDFEGALNAYHNALKCNPGFVMAASNIAYLQKCKSPDDEIILFLKKLDELKDLAIEDKIVISFALGKLYDECHEYDRAFKNYEKGNQLASNKFSFDRNCFDGICNALIKKFNSEFFNNLQKIGTDSDMPVFIVGMPRSGTSLVEQILSSHSEVTGAGELDFFNEQSGINRNDLTYFEERLNIFSGADETYLSQVANAYLQELANYASKDHKHVVDKMPYNFFNLGLISLVFPDARIINCQRDPFDTCLSVYFQYFQGFHNYSFSLENIAYVYNRHADLMTHWEQTINNPILTVQYEEIINYPEKSCKNLIDFMGLTWEDECLDFYNSRRPVFTRSNVQVRQPIYQTSINRWKNYERHIEPLKRIIRQSKT